MKVLSAKQTVAIGRALARKGKKLPATAGHCTSLRKTSGKKLAFGVLPHGTSIEVCRLASGKVYVTGHTSAKGSLHGARRRRKRK